MTIFNYTVNYIDVIVVGIVLLFSIVGYSRGLFVTLLNFLRYVFGFSICTFSANKFTQPVYDGFVKEKIVDQLSKKVVTSTNVDEIFDNLKNFVDSTPEIIKNNLNLTSLPLKTGDDIATTISDSVFQPIALVIIKGLIFVVVGILFFGITGIIISAIKNHKKKNKDKKNVLKTSDRILGGILGIVKGVFIVFVFVSIVTFVSEIDSIAKNSFFVEAQNSTLFNYILNINPFNIITEELL